VYIDNNVAAYVNVTNNSAYPVTVRAEILFGSTVISGSDATIAPGHADVVWGGSVTNPPCGENCLGRGHLSSGGWSTDLYSTQ
jgi:hypothetical protein